MNTKTKYAKPQTVVISAFEAFLYKKPNKKQKLSFVIKYYYERSFYMNINESEFELRQKRILEISDRILDKVDTALKEVDRSIVKIKEKEKIVEYDSELKKPISEKHSETEKVEIIDSVIDTASLKQIVATLKDVKDIHMGFMSQDDNEGEAEENGVIVISDIKRDNRLEESI